MGCYETINFNCRKCGAEMSAQSKSGPCAMLDYDMTSVPEDVAHDANRHAPYICECGESHTFKNSTVIKNISLEFED